MSISDPRLENPVTKFIQFKGDKGLFIYWDKEQKKQIELQLPLYFIILDQLTTIKGYNEQNNCGIYSNEVHFIDEVLTVKTFKGGINIVGKYSDIKHELKSIGGKFCKSVYAMIFSENGGTEMVNFQLLGSAFAAFMDAKINVNKYAVGIMPEMVTQTKGTNTYLEPVFKKFNMQDSLLQQAIGYDKQLQEYLKRYKNIATEEKVEVAEKTDIEFANELHNDVIDNSGPEPMGYGINGRPSEDTDIDPLPF